MRIWTESSFVTCGLLLATCGCGSEFNEPPSARSRMAIEADAGAAGRRNAVWIGPDFEQNPRAYGPASLGEIDVRGVAFDGENYLVGWQFWGNRQWAQVARVTPEGRLLDPVPLDIDDPSNKETAIAMASDGTGFLVGYESEYPKEPGKRQYRIKRISSDGVVTDPVGIAITDATRATGDLHLVSSGQNYLAVWTEQATFSYTEPYLLRAALIDDATEPPSIRYIEVGHTLASTVGCDVKLVAAANHDGYVVAYTTRNGEDFQSGFDLALVRISRTGEVIPPTSGGSTALVLGASSNSQLSLASDGDDFYLLWTDFAPNLQGKWFEAVYGIGVARDATFSGSPPSPLTTSEQDHSVPEVVFDGTQYLVSYTATDPSAQRWEPHWRGTHVSRAGVPAAEPDFELVQGKIIAPALAPTCNDGCFMAWASDVMGNQGSIFSGKYQQGPVAPADATLVSVQPEEEGFGELACNRDGCVTLYTATTHDLTGEHRYLKAAGLDLNGRLRSDSTFTITELTDRYHSPTALASDGAGYLAMWWDGTLQQLHALPLNGLGAPIPNGRRVVAGVSSMAYDLRLASLGENYLLIHTEDQSDKEILSGMLLDPSGTVIEPSTFVIDSGYYARNYATHLLAASNQYFLGFVRDSKPAVARLDRTGKLIAGSNFGVTTPNGTTASVFDMASNGQQLLVAWCDPASQTNGSSPCVPRGTLVAADGARRTLMEPLGPAGAHGWLAWSGNAYVWAWTELMSWGLAPYEQHFTELTLDAQDHLSSRDSVATRSDSAAGFGDFTMSHAGLLWTYYALTGNPTEGFVGPLRIHRRQINGLCLGDPRGDQNGDGICDSPESPLPPGGGGGAGNLSGAGGVGSAHGGAGGVGTSAGATTTVFVGGTAGAVGDTGTSAGGASARSEVVVVSGGGTSSATTGDEHAPMSNGGKPNPDTRHIVAGGNANVTSAGGNANASGGGAVNTSYATGHAGGESSASTSGTVASGGMLPLSNRVDGAIAGSGSIRSMSSGAPPDSVPGKRVLRDDGELSGSGCTCRAARSSDNSLSATAVGSLLLGMSWRRKRRKHPRAGL